MLILITLTIIAVSIDSFFYGFTLQKNNRLILTVLLQTALIFLMCFATHYIAEYLNNFITEKQSNLAGITFILTGIFSLFKKDKNKGEVENNYSVFKIIFYGALVGIDCSVANFSFSLQGLNGVLFALIFSLCHAVFVLLGMLIKKNKHAQKFSRLSFLFPVFLIIHGSVNVLEFFI